MMTAATDGPGACLRLTRVARRISSQHQRLESLYRTLARALAKGNEREAQAQLTQFGDVLAAQFSLEEDVFFPALARLWPGMRGRIVDLAREHDRFREELDQIRKRLGATEREGAKARFDRLAAELAAHDGREELLVERILGSSSAPSPGHAAQSLTRRGGTATSQ